jgi:demethylmenaquinone methyltransferase/2-methoxy-6-polyprenyl-1,4-benzoquinol methylase
MYRSDKGQGRDKGNVLTQAQYDPQSIRTLFDDMASARVVGVDISPEMARRTQRKWHFPVEVRVADVLAWDAPLALADVVVSSFGLKTFDREQQRRLAGIVAQLLKPGGSFSFVEISVPPVPLLRAAYMFYLKRVIPLLGRVLLGNPDSYRMLGVYTEAFEHALYLSNCLRLAGLEAVPASYFFGCATGVRGSKPATDPLPQGARLR